MRRFIIYYHCLNFAALKRFYPDSNRDEIQNRKSEIKYYGKNI